MWFVVCVVGSDVKRIYLSIFFFGRGGGDGAVAKKQTAAQEDDDEDEEEEEEEEDKAACGRVRCFGTIPLLLYPFKNHTLPPPLAPLAPPPPPLPKTTVSQRAPETRTE